MKESQEITLRSRIKVNSSREKGLDLHYLYTQIHFLVFYVLIGIVESLNRYPNINYPYILDRQDYTLFLE